MPAPIIKDSWSKTPPSSIYDIVRNPQAMYQQPRIQKGSTKDVLESTQQKLNREILEKWHSNAFRLSHDTFIVVAKVGKYLFLAVMLPPYVFFYGIPKWLIQIALPHSFSVAKNEFIRVGRWMNKLSTHVVDVMKGMVKQMIGDAIKTANQRARQFARSTILQFKQLWKRSIQIAKQWMKLPFTYCNRLAARLYQKSAAALKQRVVKARDRTIKILNAVGHAFHQALLAVHQRTTLPIIQWVAPKLNWVKTEAKRGYDRVRKRAEKIKSKIVDSTHAVIKSVKDSVQWTISTANNYLIQPVIQPLVQLIQPFVYIGLVLGNGVKSTTHPVIREGQRLRQKVEAISSESLDLFESIIKDAVRYCSSRLISPFKKWLNKKLNQGRALNESVSLSASEIADRAYRKVKSWFRSLLKLLQKALKWLVQQTLATPARIWRGMVKGFSLAIQGFRSAIYGIRWTLSFSWILFKYGMFLVHELANDIGQAITVRK